MTIILVIVVTAERSLSSKCSKTLDSGTERLSGQVIFCGENKQAEKLNLEQTKGGLCSAQSAESAAQTDEYKLTYCCNSLYR